MTAPGAVATARMVVVVLVLLAAGGTLYAGFVKSVLDRGDGIVDISLKSKEARGPLQLAGSGLLCLAASGLASFARPLRNRRLSPLLGIGLPLVPAAVVGISAFSLGRTALALALIVAAPSLLTMAVACLTPVRQSPGLGRFLLRSWMATGFLVGLAALALFGLDLAETVRPRVPWASVIAAMAIGTLVQLAARYVATHGAELEAVAKDHSQVRQVHETAAIRAVAARLHPFIEEGRDGDDYALLTKDLGAVARQAAPVPAPISAGEPALPSVQAGLVAALRAAAVASPVALLVPVLGWPAALVAFGLGLPFARMGLNPRKEPLPRPWWLAGALAMGGGGAWAGSFLRAPGFERLTIPLGAALAAPYAIMVLVSLRPRALPGHLAFLRLEHAKRLGQSWRRDLARGVGVAAASLALPPTLWLLSRIVGFHIQAVAWPVLLAFAVGGLLWALAGLLSGPAAARHRARLGAQHSARVQARDAAHRSFLDRLEMT